MNTDNNYSISSGEVRALRLLREAEESVVIQRVRGGNALELNCIHNVAICDAFR